MRWIALQHYITGRPTFIFNLSGFKVIQTSSPIISYSIHLHNVCIGKHISANGASNHELEIFSI